MDHVGIDVHQKYSQVCEMVEREVESRGQVPSTEAWLRRHFEGRARLRILIECGGSSRWVARLLRELGHQVVVLKPRRVRLIARITREGDSEMRRLLVQSAHTLLNSRQDSALKRWGLGLAKRSGRNKAAVAVARKLAVLLHRLWIKEETFNALPASDLSTAGSDDAGAEGPDESDSEVRMGRLGPGGSHTRGSPRGRVERSPGERKTQRAPVERHSTRQSANRSWFPGLQAPETTTTFPHPEATNGESLTRATYS